MTSCCKFSPSLRRTSAATSSSVRPRGFRRRKFGASGSADHLGPSQRTSQTHFCAGREEKSAAELLPESAECPGQPFTKKQNSIDCIKTIRRNKRQDFPKCIRFWNHNTAILTPYYSTQIHGKEGENCRFFHCLNPGCPCLKKYTF